MADIRGLLAAERRTLADELDGLTEQQWTTPSLCSGWTCRDVAAHLVFPFRYSMPKFVLGMIRYRGDFDRLADVEARGDRRSGPELAAALRANAEHPFHPPGNGHDAPLTDVIVHGQDIRRPLGIEHEFPAEPLEVVLSLLVSPKATRGLVPKGRTPGLRFEATDIGWSRGDGPLVRGPAEALVLAITGRDVAFADLQGDGVPVLRDRP